MSEIAKVCKKHGEVTKDQVVKRGKYFYCRFCARENSKKYHHINREKMLKKSKEYNKNNKDKISKKNLEWIKRNPEKARQASIKYEMKNPEKRRERLKKSNAKSVLNLSHSYVLHKIIQNTNLKAKDIPKELVLLQRELMKLRRFIRKNKT